jgi:hypothetical protein
MKTTEAFLEDAKRQAAQNEQRLEEFYAKHPSTAPTSAERTAQRLREQADQIESQDSLNSIFSMERNIKARALNCVRAVAEKMRAM